MTAPANEILTPQDARWLGRQAARRDRVDAGRLLVPPALARDYDEGADAPDYPPVRPGILDETARRRLLRALGGTAPERTEREVPPLAASIARLVQRADVGTATRYDRSLQAGARVVELLDLRASDLLDWAALRPIALDARLVLPRLAKGQADLWLAEVERAIAEVEVRQLEPEGSEAMECRDLLLQLAEASRPWEPSEDEPTPRGLVAIVRGGQIGWPRGLLLREVRSHLGRVSRVALHRACVSLGWESADWRCEALYLRVWHTDAAAWEAEHGSHSSGVGRQQSLA